MGILAQPCFHGIIQLQVESTTDFDKSLVLALGILFRFCLPGVILGDNQTCSSTGCYPLSVFELLGGVDGEEYRIAAE